MSNSINLLGHKDKVSITPASKKIALLRTIAVLLLFSVSSAAVILYILISLSPLPQVQQQEQEALQKLSLSHPEMTKIAFVQNRISGINAILKQRNQYDTFLENLISQKPGNISFYQISMSKKNATFTVRSSSLESLKNFLDSLIAESENKRSYSQVMLNSIISDETNVFSMTVTLVLL